MTVDGDLISVGYPTWHPQEPAVRPSTGQQMPIQREGGGDEPNMELLDALPNLPPGFYRKWDARQGGWVTTSGVEDNDPTSQANLTRGLYEDWWEEQMEAYRDMYGDYLLK